MKHIDLFSGIGGFALAARNVWGDEYNNVCFCEINKYAQAVLRKNFGKDVVICDDIRKLTADSYGGGCEKSINGSIRKKGVEKKQSQGDCRVDLLTGGFPCQPFSQAGQRRGTEDDRFLWPEMLRVISEFRPTWIIGENVAGLLSMAEFDGESEVASETDLFGNRNDIHTKQGRGILFRIIGELEQIGYSVQTFVIPACAVNAPHRRDRVWIVAHRNDRGQTLKELKTTRNQQCDQDVMSKSKNIGLQRSKQANCGQGKESDDQLMYGCGGEWDRNWFEVATSFCRVDDGLPVELDGFKLTKSGHRIERLKALGNAIVPQVVEKIMEKIKEIDDG